MSDSSMFLEIVCQLWWKLIVLLENLLRLYQKQLSRQVEHQLVPSSYFNWSKINKLMLLALSASLGILAFSSIGSAVLISQRLPWGSTGFSGQRGCGRGWAGVPVGAGSFGFGQILDDKQREAQEIVKSLQEWQEWLWRGTSPLRDTPQKPYYLLTY